MNFFFIVTILLLLAPSICAQTTAYIPILNPSLEDSTLTPGFTKTNHTPPYWHICFGTPDLTYRAPQHKHQPTDGHNYVALIDNVPSSYGPHGEAFGQKLICPTLPFKQHFLTVDTKDIAKPFGTYQGIYQIWLGVDSCALDTLVYEQLTHSEWKKDTIVFTPFKSYNYLSFLIKEIKENEPAAVFVDNFSPYISINNANAIAAKVSSPYICANECTNLYAWVRDTYMPYTLTWYNSDSSFISTQPNPQVCPTQTTTYYLTVDGCSWLLKDSVTVLVKPQPCQPYTDTTTLPPIKGTTKPKKIRPLALPTAFSPNNDGINDRFTLPQNQAITQAQLIVYNRYGQRVFNGNAFDGWSGVLPNNTPAPVGVYVYMFSYTNPLSGLTETQKGNITLLR